MIFFKSIHVFVLLYNTSMCQHLYSTLWGGGRGLEKRVLFVRLQKSRELWTTPYCLMALIYRYLVRVNVTWVLLLELQYHPEVIPRECSNPGHDSTQCTTEIHHMQRHAVTGAATQGSSHVMVTHGELVSTHMPKKSQVKNWLHECQLLSSVMLPLGSAVDHSFTGNYVSIRK